MNPVLHIAMVPSPRKVPFIPRSSLQSIPAIRSLAWRSGAGTADVYDPATQGVDPQFDPNVESGTGTKSAADGSASAGTTTSVLPTANQSVYNSTQVSVVPASGANLRDRPSLSGNILKGETQGTILQVLGQKNGWLNVQDPDGVSGWIYSAFVTDASAGQGTVPAPAGTDPAASTVVASSPMGAGGIVGLLVVGGLVTAAYYLLVK